MSWRGLLVIALLLAALVSGWSAWHQRADPTVETDGPVRSDFILHDFELVALSGEGVEAFTLRAPLLEQHPQDRTIEVATPLFLIPDGQGDYWEVRSQNALVTANHEEMRLREDVIAEGTGGNGQPVTMNTEQLNVFPEARTASTDQRVTVEQPGSTIQGRGMDIDLSSKRYEFHSEVKSRYVPTRR